MCYSAAASFTVGGTLVPVGAYCLWAAWAKNRRMLPLAAIPVLLAVQQVSEGFVWHALEARDEAAARSWSLIFLFFALAFWPFWSPLQAAVSESRPQRRAWLTALAVATTGWFWVLFEPLLVGPETRLTPMVMHHSIRYEFTLPIDDYVSRNVVRVAYLLSIVAPLVVGPRLFGVLPGLLLGAAAVVTAIVFAYAFASVWCFFAAVISLGLGYIFYRLPTQGLTPVGPSQGE